MVCAMVQGRDGQGTVTRPREDAMLNDDEGVEASTSESNNDGRVGGHKGVETTLREPIDDEGVERYWGSRTTTSKRDKAAFRNMGECWYSVGCRFGSELLRNG